MKRTYKFGTAARNTYTSRPKGLNHKPEIQNKKETTNKEYILLPFEKNIYKKICEIAIKDGMTPSKWMIKKLSEMTNDK